MNLNKKLVMCGCHEGGLKAIESLIKAGYRFDFFVCLTPDQGEKYNVSGYYNYYSFAKKHNIPVYTPESYSLNSLADINFFNDNKFDLLIQGGWQRLFPASILSSLSIGALGLHGSSDLLPKGRGRSPMNWSLIENRKRFLMHLFMIKPGIDDGDIIAIKDFDITEFDDIETLYIKYGMVYRMLLLENLPSVLSGKTNIISQKGEPSYYQKRSPEDGKIDWESMDVWQIYNFIRGQTKPYPGAYGEIDGLEIRIWRARPFDTRIRFDSLKYGDCIERFNNKMLINCRGGLLLIDEWEIK